MKKLFVVILPLFLFCGSIYAQKTKLARSVWFLFEQQDNLTKQPNDSVVVSYKTIMKDCFPNNEVSEIWYPQPTIVLTIKNNTERPLCVDLQKSFAVINEELYPLYIASSEVQTTSNTSIVGVNLGLVGVGSAGTISNTKITHTERFITVPNETKKSIEIPLTKWNVSFILKNVDGKMELRPAGSNGISNPNHRDYVAAFHRLIQYFIHFGEVKDYDYDDNPFILDMRLCYSFDENMSTVCNTRTVYYIKHIIGSDYKKNGQFKVKFAIDNALQIYPSLDNYLSSSDKLYFHLWTPEFMPKKK